MPRSETESSPEAPDLNGTATVLIADDHQMILEGLERIVGSADDLEVVARCSRGDEALKVLEARPTDVAVVDISMPGLDGLSLAKTAGRRNIPTRFVLLTMHDDPAYVRKAEEVGVRGFVLKDAATEELLLAVRAVLKGRRYLSSRLLDKVLAPTEQPNIATAMTRLTQAERSVLAQLADNQTSREIASALGISYRTVQNHRANICNKLALRGSNRLLEFALAHRDEL